MRLTLAYLRWAFLVPAALLVVLPLLTEFTGLPLDLQSALDQMDLATLDWRFRVRGPAQPQEKIVMVTLDQKSVGALGEPPWSRSEHARLVRRMREYGARMVVIDILFATPSASDRAGDEEFTAAMKEAGNVVLGFQMTQSSMVRQPPLDLLERFSLPETPSSDFLTRTEQMEAPFPDLLSACRGLGFMNVRQDADGRFRHAFSVLDYGPPRGDRGVVSCRLPSLALCAALLLDGVSLSEVRPEGGRGLLLRGETMPTTRGSDFAVNFVGPSGTFPTYSFSDVVEGKVDPDAFRGAAVLVGTTLLGAADLRPNPFNPFAYGVELQANILHTILSHSWITYPSAGLFYLLAFFFSLLAGAAVPRIRLWQGTLLILALGLAYLTFALRMFVAHRVCLEIVPPLAWLATAYAAVAFQMLRTERQARELVRRSFERYVAPTVVEEIVKKREPSLPMGQRRYISVLFADIRKFTATAERLDPWRVTGLLNLFFDRTSAIIFHYGGIVDKYMGDCVMALFGLLAGQDDHARRAVAAALEIQREADIMADEWRFGGALEDLQVAIGINTGEAVVGEVGSHRHTQYTAIGDTVNIAFRLQELCPDRSAKILVSGTTQYQVSRYVDSEFVGEVEVRGRQEKAEAFRVLGPRAGVAPTAQHGSSGDG